MVKNSLTYKEKILAKYNITTRNYIEMIPILIETINKLEKTIIELENRIQILEQN